MIVILYRFSRTAGGVGAAGAPLTTGYIVILACGHKPLTIESSSGKKGTYGDNEPDNNCFNHGKNLLLVCPNSYGKK
jgi:hypothetical protein